MVAPLNRAFWPIAAVLGMVLLAACSGQAASGLGAPQLRSTSYERELFPVRVVDRSKFDQNLLPTNVASPFAEKPGTIVIDAAHHHLYFVLDGGMARRYGIAVGESGKAWKGRTIVGRKAPWPTWYPTDEMRQSAVGLPVSIAPGPANPLGARALYLYQDGRDTLYRIHGTSEPWTIGTDASSGCIRMLNEDVIALFDRVSEGALVIAI